MERKSVTRNVLAIALTAAVVSACVFSAAQVFADVSSDTVIGTDLNADTSSNSEEVSAFVEYDSAEAGETAENTNSGAQEDPGTYDIDPAATDISSAESSTYSSLEVSADEGAGGELSSDPSEPSSGDVLSVINDAAGTEEISSDEIPDDTIPDDTGTDTDSLSDDADLSPLRGSMLMSAAQEQAEYEGFEVTGELSFFITNSEGIRINSWVSEKDGIYYLFVTSGEDLSAMEIYFAGVKLDLTSKGTIDKNNFVITGAFSASGEMITLTDYDNKEYRLKVMQSDLPNVMITLNGTDIDTVDSGSKDIKYTGNSVLILNSDGSLDLIQDNNVEFKGRGNTTWYMAEKKPYQIKTNKKQSVPDMNKAKKWVLLANDFDDTLMRNKLMFDIANQMGDWYACDFEYVDVWIDGNYRGNYLIGEKCEIGDNRLDLTDENAVLMELDDVFYAGEDYSIYNEKLGKHFAVSDSVSEDPDVITAAMNSFNEKLNNLMDLLNYADPDTLPIDILSSYLDVEDAVKWYLINEFAQNSECVLTSFFWYTDGDDDVLHLGPIWDFDSALGNKDYYDPDVELINYSKLFRTLIQYSSFRDSVYSVYNDYKDLFGGASSLVQTMKETIENSAEMNYTRWDRLGKENQKATCNPFAATFDEAVDWLSSWLGRRYAAFDPCQAEYYSYVKEGYIYIVYKNNKIPSATFYIWSNENGPDDMQSLIAFRNAAGSWTASVPITAFNNDGTFIIHVYSGTSLCDAFQDVFEMTPILETTLSGQNLEVTLLYNGGYLPVSAGIWSAEGGVDDLTWYPLTKQADGSYKTIVDLGTHKSTGQYFIHVYGQGVYIAGSGVVLDSCSLPSVTVSLSEENRSAAEIHADNLYGITNVRAAVWGSKNGQNDLRWYTLDDMGDGTFAALADLKAHGESGTFYFHVYGNNGGISTFLDGKSLSVSGEDVGIPDPSVDASVNGLDLSVILINAGEYPAVKAAVWSEENGQDDLAWYNMSKQNGGKFTLDVNLLPHKSFGKFIIHLYSGGSCLAGCTVQVDPPEPAYVDVQMQEMNLEVSLYNADMYPSARAAVWSEKNGQDDLAWYTMAKDSDGIYKVTVNPGLHKDPGRFIIHIYSERTNVAGCVTEVAEIEAPSLKVTADPENNNKVIISLVNAYGLKNVRTAVWGSKNGQNDIKWYTLADRENGTFTAEPDLTSHGESGMFYFHAYGSVNGKDSFIDGKELDLSGITIPEPVLETELDGQFLTIYLKYAQNYPAATAAVWSEENGQDDVVRYELTKQSDETYSANINLGLHKSTGQFIIHVYSGKTFIAGERVELDSYEAMELMAEADENGSGKVTVSVINACGVKNVKVAIWGSKDGQNDVNWYSLKETDTGTFSADIDLSSHNETGVFFIHAYGTNNGTNVFINGIAINIVIYNKNIGRPDSFVANAEQALSLAGRTGDNKLDILFLGNSLTYHGVGLGWFGEWGMAASAEDQDFVHVVQQAFSPYVDTSCRAYNFWRYEKEADKRAALLSTLDSVVRPSDDLIVLQIGDNAMDAATWNKDLEALIIYCKNLAPDAKIVMLGNFLHHSGAEYVKEIVAEKQKLQMLSIYDIADDPMYKCGIGTYVTGTDGKMHEVTLESVAGHPGDWGMALIGKRIVKASIA